MNEILNGIKVIKMYCWEKSFGKLVEDTRKSDIVCITFYFYKIDFMYREEINVIKKTCNFRAFKISFFFTASRLIQLVTFLVFGLTGHSVTAENAFLVVSMFNTVRLSMTLFFPLALSQLREVRASVRRIQVIEGGQTTFSTVFSRTSCSWRRKLRPRQIVD